MSVNWGPHFIVPSKKLVNLSGKVVLRESFDEELLKKELTELGFSGSPFRATNPWYFRKKNNETWIKIGESEDRENWFSVPWDTTTLENGDYQVFGLMHVFIKEGDRELVLCRQNMVDVKVENPA
jgi:hypothetical protein